MNRHVRARAHTHTSIYLSIYLSIYIMFYLLNPKKEGSSDLFIYNFEDSMLNALASYKKSGLTDSFYLNRGLNSQNN